MEETMAQEQVRQEEYEALQQGGVSSSSSGGKEGDRDEEEGGNGGSGGSGSGSGGGGEGRDDLLVVRVSGPVVDAAQKKVK